MGKEITCGILALIFGTLLNGCVTKPEPALEDCYVAYTRLEYQAAQEGLRPVHRESSDIHVLMVHVKENSLDQHVILILDAAQSAPSKDFKPEAAQCKASNGRTFTIYKMVIAPPPTVPT